VPVEVPAREGPHIDVVRWMREVVGTTMSREHDRLSPHCHPQTLNDVWIPNPEGSEFLGQQVE